MAAPIITSLTIDGTASNGSLPLSLSDSPAVHDVEVYGSGILNGQQATPEVIGRVNIAIIPYHKISGASGISVLRILGVSDTQVRFQMNVRNGVIPGVYRIGVLNGSGISPASSFISQSFRILPTVPNFVMSPILNGTSGQTVTFGIDSYDPVRDAGIRLTVGDASVSFASIGSNMTNSEFVTDAFNVLLSRNPTPGELLIYSNYISGANARIALPAKIAADYNFTLPAYYAIGTKITAVISSSSAVAIGIRTDRGISKSSVYFIPVADAPLISPSASSSPQILYVFPRSAVPGTTVNIGGDNFTSSTVFYLGSAVLTTTFVSSSLVTFVLSSATAANKYAITASDANGSDTFNGFTFLNPDASQPTASASLLSTTASIAARTLQSKEQQQFQGTYSPNYRGYSTGAQLSESRVSQPSFTFDVPYPASQLASKPHAPVAGKSSSVSAWRNPNATPVNVQPQSARFIPLSNSARNTITGVQPTSQSATPPARVRNAPPVSFISLSVNGNTIPNTPMNGAEPASLHSAADIEAPTVIKSGILEHIDPSPVSRGGGF